VEEDNDRVDDRRNEGKYGTPLKSRSKNTTPKKNKKEINIPLRYKNIQQDI
jgi:hypothetical protein